MFKFYLQKFTGVECGFLLSRGGCPICKRFRSTPHESCPHILSHPLLLSAPVVLPNLQEKLKKTLCLKYSYTEKSRDVKSGDRGGQTVVPPRLVQATTHNTVRVSHRYTTS